MRRPSPAHRALIACLAWAAFNCAPASPGQIKADTLEEGPAKTRTLARDKEADAPAEDEGDNLPVESDPEEAPDRPVVAVDVVKKDLPYTRIIDPKRDIPGSLSLGSTASGILLRSATLPLEGEHHAVLANVKERNTNFGTEELVEVLLHAAKAVHTAHKGPRLMMGNLAVKGGGDIKWSRSHNSGRDADIAFYVLDKSGKPVEAPSLLDINRDLEAASGLFKLDVPRNWALVKGLLTHPTTQIQWLFVATWIKDALIEYATAQGEPEDLIEKASKLLWQPTDSSPHSNHLHLRIFCPKADLLEGCLNGSPVWDWVDTYTADFGARVAALSKGLLDPDPEIRMKVLSHMEKIRATTAAHHVANIAIFDSDPEIRSEALKLLGRWRPSDERVYRALEAFIRGPGGGIAKDDATFTFQARKTTDADKDDQPEAKDPLAPPAHADPHTPDKLRTASQIILAYNTLKRLASHRAIPLLTQALASERHIGSSNKKSTAERTLAARAAGNIVSLRLVPPLIDALDTPDENVRAAAAYTLRRITNHTFSIRWDRPTKTRARKRNVEKWRRFWKDNKHRSRNALVLKGFKKAKIKIKDLNSYSSIDKLVKITRRDDHLGYNAALILSHRCGRWKGLASATASRRAQKWTRWWKKNKLRMKRRWRRS